MELLVRRLSSQDVEVFKDLRREGLILEPANFESSAEEEATIDDEEWSARLSRGGTFGVFDADELVGIAGFRAESGAKTAHRGHLSSVYVRPKARGSGAAGLLMKSVIEAAKRDVAFLYLVVTQSNARAIRFYEKHGFAAYGRDPGGLLVDGTLYEDCLMVLQLRNPIC
ncbi:ribosomal protein S18 acetylase RimI-like enzyme [Pararhizobium capsulatum DSM 1112]|uniref:Ribosomal protein S18 acetylase RimI-like enzyme n=1 Tax=Pararhizobium capsulatum DSM 1112 TaxID=1121113 RepID=A0ABU0BQS4_9HYPH|nr:GNAT family N-acetyltransferase [Pararhizobium capsulatum]MDQ0320591.1 ribosomal protein S18 acetylase RimI-like enzyme [Pararhizobium capsulatum DSM 1112]